MIKLATYPNADVVELNDPCGGIQRRTGRSTPWSPKLWVPACTPNVITVSQLKVTVWHEATTTHTHHRTLFVSLQVRDTVK